MAKFNLNKARKSWLPPWGKELEREYVLMKKILIYYNDRHPKEKEFMEAII